MPRISRTILDPTSGVCLLSAALDPVAAGLDAPIGSLFTRSDTGQLYRKTGAGAAGWVETVGSGSGGSVAWASISGIPANVTNAITQANGDARYRQLSAAIPYADLTGVPAFAQVGNANAFTAANSFSNTTTFNGAAAFNAQFTVNTAALFSLGAEAVQVKASANDHTFLAFYARTLAQNTRSGWMGYGSSGTQDLTIANETPSGWLTFRARGAIGAQIADTGVLSDTFRRAAGSRMMSFQSPSYTVLYDASDRAALYLGNTGDPRNYYDNTNHRWRDAAGTTTQMELSTTGLTVPGTYNGSGQMTVGRATTASEVTVANFVNTFVGVTGLYVNCNGATGAAGIVRLYASGDTNKEMQFLTGNSVALQILADRSLVRLYGTNGRVALRGDADGNQGIWFSNNESTWFFGRNGGDGMRFFRAGTDIATVNSSGIFAVNFGLSSDIRLKSNVETLGSALDKLMQVRGVSYTMRGAREVGLIAQEIHEVLPEAVVTQDDGYLAVLYDRVIPLLVEAVKDLRKEVWGLRCQH
jgi:hypothetical protein